MQGAVISLTALIEQLGVMGLSEYEELVANYCIDEGLEIVPLKELTKHLRDAGMPAVRALAVKNAAQATAGATGPSPVSVCVRACVCVCVCACACACVCVWVCYIVALTSNLLIMHDHI